jgi:hypothetical protein
LLRGSSSGTIVFVNPLPGMVGAVEIEMGLFFLRKVYHAQESHLPFTNYFWKDIHARLQKFQS